MENEVVDILNRLLNALNGFLEDHQKWREYENSIGYSSKEVCGCKHCVLGRDAILRASDHINWGTQGDGADL